MPVLFHLNKLLFLLKPGTWQYVLGLVWNVATSLIKFYK